MRVVLVDNLDSFSFNLVDALRRLGCEVRVLRNTAPAPRIVELAERGLIVLSPGPGGPAEAGCCLEVIALARGRVPLLGVCLGHQAIVAQAGGPVTRAPAIVHGKASPLVHDGQGFMRGLPSPLVVGRYHSLATPDVPARLHVHGAIEGMAMAISDPAAGQVGVQFHPESILTPHGERLLSNVVEDAAAWRPSAAAHLRPVLEHRVA